jgi:hypothetical protein
VRFGQYVVPSAVAWILKPIGRGPAVRAEFEMQRGQPVCTSLEITAQPGGRPVTTADLAELPGLDRKAVEAFQALAVRTFDDHGPNLGRGDAIFRPDRRKVREALGKPPDQELDEVARVYRDNIDNAPVQAVELAMPHLSRRTIDRRIREARDRGFLPKTTRGRKKA